MNDASQEAFMGKPTGPGVSKGIGGIPTSQFPKGIGNPLIPMIMNLQGKSAPNQQTGRFGLPRTTAGKPAMPGAADLKKRDPSIPTKVFPPEPIPENELPIL